MGGTARAMMSYRLLAGCIAALTVAAVTSCGSASPHRTAAVTAGSSRAQASQASVPAACRGSELGTRLQAGGYGGGNDFASIEIWNPAGVPCRLAGPVTFSAFFADGTADRNARQNRPLTPLAVTLPARMLRPGEGADPSAYLWATLMGPERDDPAQPNGSCRSKDELTPATLVLSIGPVTLRIRNLDPASATRSNLAVYGCHGRVLLEGLTRPAAQ